MWKAKGKTVEADNLESDSEEQQQQDEMISPRRNKTNSRRPPASPPVRLVEDTEESDDDDDESDLSGGIKEDDDEEGLPLMKYTRLFGSLPRRPEQQGTTNNNTTTQLSLAVPCTCTTMGKVVLNPDTTSNMSESSQDDNDYNMATTWQQHPIHVTAMGFQDGQVYLMDALTGMAVATPEQLKVREGSSGGRNSTTNAIVGLSMDSTGTFLAALDAGGMCAIFEFKYTIQMQSTHRASISASGHHHNVFSSFMSAITGSQQQQQQQDSGEGQRQQPDETLVPTLTTASIQVQRISYPKSFGAATCLALDPAFRRKREKSILTGFADGRLVSTKRGFFLQRRNDQVVYQAIQTDDKSFMGIETIAWRGSLVAWADCTGVRLMDADNFNRIAHVDRPAGARPTLYPTVRPLKPSIVFETSHRLLVAWGDCLLQLYIREMSKAPAPPPPPSNSPTSLEAPPVVRRRTVECSMAWELDCVTCGVAPLDEQHVVVLGLMVPTNEEGDFEGGPNDVELQVVSRTDGTVVYSDLLPLIRNTKNLGGGRRNNVAKASESAAAYSLLSSFVLPRMEDNIELYEEGLDGDENMEPVQTNIFGADSKRTFRDPHKKWNLKMVSFEDEEDGNEPTSDTDSVDSDDYGFIFRPIKTDVADPSASKPGMPPVMIISSSSDTVLASMRDVDDAVESALASKKPALALKRALRRLRRLRRYDITDLVNEYFRAVLRIPGSKEDGKEKAGDDTKLESKDEVDGAHLSLRRMKLAAAAMPVLLGCNVPLWEQWITELEKIPGALFVVRSYLPVRDPKLPKKVYAQALEKMFQQIAEMRRSSQSESVERLAFEAGNHFLNTLLSWGTTSVLKDHIKLYQYQTELDISVVPTLRAVEDSLKRRSEQTAAVYLNFPAQQASALEETADASAIRAVGETDETSDSLFEVDELLDMLERSALRVASESVPVVDGDLKDSENEHYVTRIALDAEAKLDMMQGRFDDALRSFLTIGTLTMSSALEEIEDAAIAIGGPGTHPGKGDTSRKIPYAYVVAFVENHHLHQCLLDPAFLLEEISSPPLFALLRLVGLELMGEFLMKHCVAPQQKSSDILVSQSPSKTDKTSGERRGTLPLDLVAEQLQASPKLLYWYLHLVFIRMPEVYVKFPNTSIPPPVVAGLHQKALNLYIKYAGNNRDSAKALNGIEAYRVADATTPLLSFLKTVLQLGGIRPAEVGKMLEKERKGGAGVSHIFALELAYIMEHFGDDSEAEAKVILELYLEGAQSLMLAVSFAQRAQAHSEVLWEILLAHCLSGSNREASGAPNIDGALFGSLLEAAALSGANLAHLVTQIPERMAIEGLRPRLVAAVADYRLKLQMHESSTKVAEEEKVDLLREFAHRARRGVRYEYVEKSKPQVWEVSTSEPKTEAESTKQEGAKLLPGFLRTKERHDRHYLACRLPMR